MAIVTYKVIIIIIIWMKLKKRTATKMGIEFDRRKKKRKNWSVRAVIVICALRTYNLQTNTLNAWTQPKLYFQLMNIYSVRMSKIFANLALNNGEELNKWISTNTHAQQINAIHFKGNSLVKMLGTIEIVPFRSAPFPFFYSTVNVSLFIYSIIKIHLNLITKVHGKKAHATTSGKGNVVE